MSGKRITGEKEKKRIMKEYPELRRIGRRLRRTGNVRDAFRLAEIYDKIGRPDLKDKILGKAEHMVKRYEARTRRVFDRRLKLWRYAITGRFYDPVLRRTVMMVKGRFARSPYIKRWW